MRFRDWLGRLWRHHGCFSFLAGDIYNIWPNQNYVYIYIYIYVVLVWPRLTLRSRHWSANCQKKTQIHASVEPIPKAKDSRRVFTLSEYESEVAFKSAHRKFTAIEWWYKDRWQNSLFLSVDTPLHAESRNPFYSPVIFFFSLFFFLFSLCVRRRPPTPRRPRPRPPASGWRPLTPEPLRTAYVSHQVLIHLVYVTF